MGMKKGFALALCLIWTWATSGMAGNSPVTNGVYRESTKVETVSIQGEEIEFQILVPYGKEERLIKRKYKYDLLPGSYIRVSASSNDAVFVFGIMKYEWLWDGKAIVRKQVKGGGATVFERE
jgi:hypothetical protein